jgi:hypothetical protein
LNTRAEHHSSQLLWQADCTDDGEQPQP